MRRARLHEAAERADSGEPVDWALLASDLGYADQAHLTRDFTVTIGVPPARYAAAPLPGALRGCYRAGDRVVRGGAVLRRMMSLVGTVTARSISSPCSSPRTIWPASRPC
jgi:AraC-type DNA-binding domain-containing proteins